MLDKKVVLAQLQIRCPKHPTTKTLVEQIAGQLYNLFYATSFPWSDGSLGRVISVMDFEDFYGEYVKLSTDFYKAVDRKEKDRFGITLTVLPFPRVDDFPKGLPEQVVHEATAEMTRAAGLISADLEKRFDVRLRMLLDSLQEGKRFYTSLLTELEKVIDKGVYLAGNDRRVLPTSIITPQLFGRMLAARAGILIYSADEIRQSTSAKEDVINQCGAIL
jgi:hypothetical protein